MSGVGEMYVESDVNRWFSDSLKDLLSKILVPDPSARIGLYNVTFELTLSIPHFKIIITVLVMNIDYTASLVSWRRFEE